jgi:hypothetical protein
MYAGSIDETLKEATLPTSALRTPNQQKRRACRLVEIYSRISQAFAPPLLASLRLSNGDSRRFHPSMVSRIGRVSVATHRCLRTWLPVSSVLSACYCLDRHCVLKPLVISEYDRTISSASTTILCTPICCATARNVWNHIDSAVVEVQGRQAG